MQGSTQNQRTRKVHAFAFLLVAIFSIIATGFYLAQIHERTDQNSSIILLSRINPNSADMASLTRLPGIGPSRASAIIAYRQKINANNHKKVFNNPNDLEIIKGIGPKTVDKIQEYLIFE